MKLISKMPTMQNWWRQKMHNNTPETMNDFFSDLRQVAYVWLANVVGMVAQIMPLIQFVAICLGILVSCSTLVIHIQKIKELFKKKTP